MKRMSKKILVTGCNGQLGRAINKEYAGSDVTFINTDVAEGEGVTALAIMGQNAGWHWDHCRFSRRNLQKQR